LQKKEHFGVFHEGRNGPPHEGSDFPDVRKFKLDLGWSFKFG